MAKRWLGKTGKVFAEKQSKVKLNDVRKWLGKEHFIESDPLSTHSGIERYWVFDVGSGLALCFKYLDPIETLMIGSNKDSPINAKLLQRLIWC